MRNHTANTTTATATALTGAVTRDRWHCFCGALADKPHGLCQKAGRAPGGGAVLEPSARRSTHRKVTAAFELAVLEGRLVRDPVKLVEPPEYTPGTRDTWSREQVRNFLTWAAMDRLHAAWRLSLYGLRRGEVLGLRWSDIELETKKLTVEQAPILVESRIRIEEPKSRYGKRTLPLDEELLQALIKLRKRQALDRLQAGSAYQKGLDELDWYAPGDAYVVTDELGLPVHPSGTLTSSPGCSDRRSYPGSGCTTPGTPR